LGRELGARYLAMGEMHREGGKFAVLMHLIDTDTGADAWSDRFEFDAAEAEGKPVRFAERVERRLWDGVLESAKAYASSHSVPGDAWNAYLRALANWERSEDASVARKQFGEVLRLDPEFVPALASQSDAILAQFSTASELDEARVRQDIEEVAVGTGDSYAWSVRADALSWMARWDEALAAISRAQELDPGSLLRVLDQAWILMLMGRPGEALTLTQRAIAMDPETIDTEWTNSIAGLQCRNNIVLGRYLDATPACERLGAGGKNWRRQATLAAVYAQQGEMSKAKVAKAAALKLEPRLSIAYMKRLPQPGSQAYLDLLDTYYYAGLRKAGMPEE
jgi:tetratricopeptide (TPR) repeat protein